MIFIVDSLGEIPLIYWLTLIDIKRLHLYFFNEKIQSVIQGTGDRHETISANICGGLATVCLSLFFDFYFMLFL